MGNDNRLDKDSSDADQSLPEPHEVTLVETYLTMTGYMIAQGRMISSLMALLPSMRDEVGKIRDELAARIADLERKSGLAVAEKMVAEKALQAVQAALHGFTITFEIDEDPSEGSLASEK